MEDDADDDNDEDDDSYQYEDDLDFGNASGGNLNAEGDDEEFVYFLSFFLFPFFFGI